MSAEARSFAALLQGDSARNLIRVFLLQDRLKGLAGKSAAPLERVHVIGAGVMGGDIAAWCALRGLNVTLQDRELTLIEPALARARRTVRQAPVDPGRAQCRRRAAACRCRGQRCGRCGRRHRGHLRGSGRQAGAVRGRRAAHAGRRGARQQHLQPDARIARRHAGRPRPPGRPAFLQPGGADAAGGSGALSAYPSGGAGERDGVHAPHRQAAAALPQQPRVPGQSRAVSVPVRSAACRRGRHRVQCDR